MSKVINILFGAGLMLLGIAAIEHKSSADISDILLDGIGVVLIFLAKDRFDEL